MLDPKITVIDSKRVEDGKEFKTMLGDSTCVKPTNADFAFPMAENSLFIELDTKTGYYWQSNDWKTVGGAR